MTWVECIYSVDGLTVGKQYKVYKFQTEFTMFNKTVRISSVQLLKDNGEYGWYLIKNPSSNSTYFVDVVMDISHKVRNDIINDILD